MARVCEPVCASLNKGDVFVLIDPSTRKIYEWRGVLANKMEVAKGMDFSGRVKNKEFGGRADIFVMEEGKTDNAFPEFWQLLGGKTHISEAKAAGDDDDEDKKAHGDTLYGFAEASGKFVAKEVSSGRLLKEVSNPLSVHYALYMAQTRSLWLITRLFRSNARFAQQCIDFTRALCLQRFCFPLVIIYLTSLDATNWSCIRHRLLH